MENSESTKKQEAAPDLSVIVPVHNGAERLEEVVRELLLMKHIPYEVIIIDDHSSDATQETAERLAEDGRVSLRRTDEPIGPWAARNLGLSLAKGQYVAFLDADIMLFAQIEVSVLIAKDMGADILHPGAHYVPIPDQHVHFDDKRTAAIVRDFKIEGNDRLRLEGSPEDVVAYFFKNGFPLTTAGKLFRRGFLLEHGIRFPEDVRFAADLLFLTECMLHAGSYVLHHHTAYIQGNSKVLLYEEASAPSLRDILEDEARGLGKLDGMFRNVSPQALLSRAKEKYCERMDQRIAPLSRKEPGIWEEMIREGIPILGDPWWSARHLAGWHRNRAELQRLLAEKKNQERAMAATEELLDHGLRAPYVIVLSSIYTMMLCLLYLKGWEKAVFVCCGGVPKGIIGNLREQGILCYGEGDGHFINDVHALRCIARYAERNHIPVYGNDDPPDAGQFLRPGVEFIAVEDGTANYQPEGVMKQKNVGRITAGGEQYIPFAFSRFVEHVILTGKQEVPEIVKDKAELIDVQKLWDAKPKKEQDRILALYGFPRKAIEQEIRKGRDCLLIGMAHGSIGLCKKEQEIAMYRDMMEAYGGEGRFIIKPHHQNNIDLGKEFPGCFILPKDFPIDLAKLLKLRFRHVVGADSTALLRLFPQRIVEDRSDLQEKHGIPRGNALPEEKE